MELEPAQLAWVLDELDERRRPLDEELHRLRAACASDSGDEDAAARLAARSAEARELAHVRAQLLASFERPPLVLVGPRDLVRDVVAATARHAADTLAEMLRRPAPDAEELRRTTDAVTAWTRTLLALG